jgi:hypothetical protein
MPTLAIAASVAHATSDRMAREFLLPATSVLPTRNLIQLAGEIFAGCAIRAFLILLASIIWTSLSAGYFSKYV